MGEVEAEWIGVGEGEGDVWSILSTRGERKLLLIIIKIIIIILYTIMYVICNLFINYKYMYTLYIN